jgi:hypothetical protein
MAEQDPSLGEPRSPVLDLGFYRRWHWAILKIFARSGKPEGRGSIETENPTKAARFAPAGRNGSSERIGEAAISADTLSAFEVMRTVRITPAQSVLSVAARNRV